MQSIVNHLNEEGVQSMICPEDIEKFEKQNIFYIVKFLSTVVVYPLTEYFPSIINPLAIINILEAIIVEFKGKTYTNMSLGILLNCSLNYLKHKTFVIKNDGLIIWFIMYHFWNLKFCKNYADFKTGIIHNGIPFVYTLLLLIKCRDSNLLLIKWGQIRGICLATLVGSKYFQYLRTKDMLKKI